MPSICSGHARLGQYALHEQHTRSHAQDCVGHRMWLVLHNWMLRMKSKG